MTDLVRFQELITGLSSSESQEADLLLLQLPPQVADLTRLCAIPHTFDASVLQVLDPTLQPVAAQEAIAQIQESPAVVQLADCLALHDVVRKQLFLQWLSPQNSERFKAVSLRLAEFFRPSIANTAAAAARHHSYLFHLIGADQQAGFRELQRIYQETRDQSRFGECETLFRLLSEYESVLTSEQRAWMKYYQAEIADDNRNWTKAIELLQTMLGGSLPGSVQSMALLRLGSVLRKIGKFDEATSQCRACLEMSEQLKEGAVPRRLIHHELGIIARDSGNFGEAKKHLKMALELAKAEGDRLDIAMAYNSLGILFMKTAPADAVAALEQCLSLLQSPEDMVRRSQVLNNLALSLANSGKWEQSEEYYLRSLELKRGTGDLYGLASTLMNVGRVFWARQKKYEAEKALLESAALFQRVNAISLSAKAYRDLARLIAGDSPSPEALLHAHKAIELFALAGNDTEVDATKREFPLDRPRTKWKRWTLLVVALCLVAGALIIVALIQD